VFAFPKVPRALCSPLFGRRRVALVSTQQSRPVIQVLLRGEILGCSRLAGRSPLPRHGSSLNSRNIGQLDFFRTSHLRKAIHARVGGFCFYCRRRITSSVQCLDHVVPQVRSGANSYRNLVSCCLECNSRKGKTPAADFLRWLYRERRLTGPELTRRLRALDHLAAGKLRPVLALASGHDYRRNIGY
jgi:hypothetical protein